MGLSLVLNLPPPLFLPLLLLLHFYYPLLLSLLLLLPSPLLLFLMLLFRFQSLFVISLPPFLLFSPQRLLELACSYIQLGELKSDRMRSRNVQAVTPLHSVKWPSRFISKLIWNTKRAVTKPHHVRHLCVVFSLFTYQLFFVHEKYLIYIPSSTILRLLYFTGVFPCLKTSTSLRVLFQVKSLHVNVNIITYLQNKYI